MNLSWTLLALALIGAEDQQPRSPSVPMPPVSGGIGLSRALRGPIALARKVHAANVPDACLATMPDRPCGGCPLLEEISANLCPEDILDGSMVAVCALPRDVGLALRADDRPTELAGSGHGTPPMPKVAPPRKLDQAEAPEVWPMTLPEAIRIALDNSEIVRVISFGGAGVPIGGFEPIAVKTTSDAKRVDPGREPIVIARLNADASLWRFKAEVMAEVRSVEQQYWNLAQAHVQLWAAERAVTLAEEVLNREQAELMVGHGTVADVAEAQQRLEQLRLDLVTRTSAVITTERQLRNLLGLPPADNRRIIPVTSPTEARLELDWDSSLAVMLAQQPDVVQQRLFVRLAELGLLAARNQMLPLLGSSALHHFQGLGHHLDPAEAVVGGAMLKWVKALAGDRAQAEASDLPVCPYKEFTTWQVGLTYIMPMATGRSPLANTRQAQYVLIRSRARYQQIVHQTTHSLARFFLEIDANYKQFRTASHLRQAAAQRLNAQRACYEEGRITVDRFLDAVSQYATAVAAEAQYRATYNIAIIALEEAKGTLLTHDNIVVADGPRPRKVPAAPVLATSAPSPGPEKASGKPSKPDERVVTAFFDDAKARKIETPPDRVPPPSREAGPATPASGKTWTFSISIGGASPLRIQGTITASEGAPAAH